MSENEINSKRFTKTALVLKKEFNEKLAKGIFFSMTLAMIVPLLLIVSFLINIDRLIINNNICILCNT